MSHHRYTPVDDLRKSTRFPREHGTDFAAILHPDGEEMLVEVHDESLGGLAVHVEDAAAFAVGCEVEIVYAGEFSRARVCHVESYRKGGYIVGFACERISDGVGRQSVERPMRTGRGIMPAVSHARCVRND